MEDRRAARLSNRLLALVAAAALAVTGCGQPAPDFLLVNRTEAVLAIAPGVVLEPCSEVAFSEATLRAAGERLSELTQNDIDGDDLAWIPGGAVHWEGIPPRRIGAPAPMTFVISGSQPAYVEYGVRLRSLPPCEGQPLFQAETLH